jgi:hypothetical protein
MKLKHGLVIGFAAILLTAAFALAGCGGGDDDSGGTGTETGGGGTGGTGGTEGGTGGTEGTGGTGGTGEVVSYDGTYETPTGERIALSNAAYVRSTKDSDGSITDYEKGTYSISSTTITLTPAYEWDYLDEVWTTVDDPPNKRGTINGNSIVISGKTYTKK